MANLRKENTAAVAAYLDRCEPNERLALQALGALLKEKWPSGVERIGYQIIIFSDGKDLVGYGSQAKHLSFYTMSPKLAKEIPFTFPTIKPKGTTIHFAPTTGISDDVVLFVLEARLKEVGLVL